MKSQYGEPEPLCIDCHEEPSSHDDGRCRDCHIDHEVDSFGPGGFVRRFVEVFGEMGKARRNTNHDRCRKENLRGCAQRAAEIMAWVVAAEKEVSDEKSH